MYIPSCLVKHYPEVKRRKSLICLFAQERNVKQELREITPPPPCCHKRVRVSAARFTGFSALHSMITPLSSPLSLRQGFAAEATKCFCSATSNKLEPVLTVVLLTSRLFSWKKVDSIVNSLKLPSCKIFYVNYVNMKLKVISNIIC